MSVYGYIHSTSYKYDLDYQYHEIESFAFSASLGKVDFYVEVGASEGDFPVLAAVVDSLDADDVLLVSELFRLGSSLDDILIVLCKVSEAGATLHASNSGYHLEDDEQRRLVMDAVALVAQAERELALSTPEALKQQGQHPWWTSDPSELPMSKGVDEGIRRSARSVPQIKCQGSHAVTFREFISQRNVDC